MTGFWPHLLESTLFAGVVWLTALALRRSPARTRHALWLAASVKFLVPFALLVSLGSQLVRREAVPVPPPEMRIVMVETAPAAATSARPAVFGAAAAVGRDWRPLVLWMVWGLGCAGILVRWRLRWCRAAIQLRDAVRWNSPVGVGRLPVAAYASADVREPGVFGIFRPVLLLPAGIEERLSVEQLQTVVAHELCHVQRRDNLAAAIHTLVEAVFWFHPLVWWMGAWMVEERERACDEEVVALGNNRAVYAESILEVCRFCLEPSGPCVSAITGADLKERVRNIMTARSGQRLGPGKKLLLAAMGLAAAGGPLAMGLMHPAEMGAQAPQTAPAVQFEAASVKVPADQNMLETRPKRTPGRFRWTTQMAYLIEYAYHMQNWRIIGGHLGSIYEVEATYDSKATEDQVRLMLQSLLIDRFKMALHREAKDADGYALTVAKEGLNIEEAKEGEIPGMPAWFRRPADDPAKFEEFVTATMPARGVTAITGRRATMLQFCETLQRLVGTAVLDQTGLSGKYYFALQYTDEDTSDIPYPNLSTAIRKLGLRLEKHKGPVEMLVIDHIEKVPAEN